jgi:hypothetical protein
MKTDIQIGTSLTLTPLRDLDINGSQSK